MLLTSALTVLLTTPVATAADEAVPKQPKRRLFLEDTTVARINPLGLITFGQFTYQLRLYESDSEAFDRNFIGFGVGFAASPAFGRGGPMVEIQPLSILRMWAMVEGIGYFGSFGFFQSFPSARSCWSDSCIEAQESASEDSDLQNYATGGWQLSTGATAQIKLGPIAARSILRAGRPSFNMRDGDTTYYEPLFDLLVGNDSWYVNNDVDLLWVFDFGLAAGVRWTWARAFYTQAQLDAAPNETIDDFIPNEDAATNRFGPFAAYRFRTSPRGTGAFNNPTLIAILNWWLQHPYRTGQDVTQGLPYIIIGFKFDGDVLAKF